MAFEISDELKEDALELYNVNVDEVLTANNAKKMRILRQGDGATMDYDVDRINIIVNAQNQILRMYMG